ncbi:hypothetical protein SAMN02910382_00433 [Butyrivibrio sp. TB]|jgi:hypothetical protein|nr:hypothetical protein SAMN02910382_00433 [Butyrivibrio sp. TB]
MTCEKYLLKTIPGMSSDFVYKSDDIPGMSICIKLDNHNNFQKILYPLLVKKVLDTAYILVV